MALNREAKNPCSEEERFRHVTQTSVDAIITTDAEGTILTWNRGAEEMFGHDQGVLGQNVEIIIPPKWREAHHAGMHRYLDTGETRFLGSTVEIEGLRKDGEIFPCELSLSTWTQEDEVFFGGIIRDITERKRTERLREDVQRMIRHDLRSPLVGVTGLADLMLKSGNLDENQRDKIETIHELGSRTLALLDRWRDLFQMEQGDYQLAPDYVDIFEIFRNIAPELSACEHGDTVHVTYSVNGENTDLYGSYYVHGEEALLEVMFSNLIKNAIEASPEGETVMVDLTPIDPDIDGGHRIDVHNKGVIPEAIRDSFFEPYVTAGKKYGQGLGTHSARLVARAHGGDIDYTTDESEGTHLIVTLPAHLPESPKEPTGRTQS